MLNFRTPRFYKGMLVKCPEYNCYQAYPNPKWTIPIFSMRYVGPSSSNFAPIESPFGPGDEVEVVVQTESSWSNEPYPGSVVKCSLISHKPPYWSCLGYPVRISLYKYKCRHFFFSWPYRYCSSTILTTSLSHNCNIILKSWRLAWTLITLQYWIVHRLHLSLHTLSCTLVCLKQS